MKYDLSEAVICVIGLGYVGLPLAEAFSQRLKVIGFDSDTEKVRQLLAKQSGRRESTAEPRLTFTTEPQKISEADFEDE